MIYLHKILPLLVSPIMLVIYLLILGIIAKSKKISFAAILILLFSSLPFISKKLTYYLEADYRPIPVSDIDKADAIVVLGGMIGAIKIVKEILRYFHHMELMLIKDKTEGINWRL